MRHMSDDEIVCRYRQAKDRPAQIGILADLCACEKREIIGVLSRHGFEFPKNKKKKPPARKLWTEADNAELKRMVQAGILPVDIAARMGRTKIAIENRICVLRKAGQLTMGEDSAKSYDYSARAQYLGRMAEILMRTKTEGVQAAVMLDGDLVCVTDRQITLIVARRAEA